MGEPIRAAPGQGRRADGPRRRSRRLPSGRHGLRRTFYEQFKNKEDAFLAAYDAVLHQLVRHVQHAYLRETTARTRLRAGIEAFLRFLAGERPRTLTTRPLWIFSTLCRRRHKQHYADLRIMPMWPVKLLVGAVLAA